MWILITSAWTELHTYCLHDLPELVKAIAAAGAARHGKLPTSIAAARSFTVNNWLDASPPLSAGIASTALIASSVATLVRQVQGSHREVADVVDTRHSFWLARETLLRGMGLCYCMAFVVWATQHRALSGSLGLNPVSSLPSRPMPAFQLLSWLGYVYEDWQLELVSWLGVAAGFQMLLGKIRCALVPAISWALYLSLCNLTDDLTDPPLLSLLPCELGFLIIFLCPLWTRNDVCNTPPPKAVLWLIRWMCIRVMLGSGLSKRGVYASDCWRTFTCTTTHYFTQPVPTPLAWYMHQLPSSVHEMEGVVTLVMQLVFPFMMLVPNRRVRLAIAVLEICYQVVIELIGNYGWLNLLSILLCVEMLDDAFLGSILPRCTTRSVLHAANASYNKAAPATGNLTKLLNKFHNACLFLICVVVVCKSKHPIKDLLSEQPWINKFDDWLLVNSVGVFAVVGTHRIQPMIKYTHDLPDDENATWHFLHFKALPGDPMLRPVYEAPYMNRLDFLLWYETILYQDGKLSPGDLKVPGLFKLLSIKLLNGDDDTIGLLGSPRRDLLPSGKPPTAIAVDIAAYTFTSFLSEEKSAWWHTKKLSASSKIYLQSRYKMKSASIRRSPPERHRVMGFCIIGAAVSVDSAVAPCEPWRRITRVMISALFAQMFTLALLSDYDHLWQSAVHMLPQLSCCSMAGSVSVAERWRCCYSYLFYCSSIWVGIIAIMLAEGWRRRRRIYATDAMTVAAFAYVASSTYDVLRAL